VSFSDGATTEPALFFLGHLLDTFAVLQLPELAACSRLKSHSICGLRVLITKRTIARIIVALDGSWEADHVADDTSWRVRLRKSRVNASPCQARSQLQTVSVAESIQAGSCIADPAHVDLLGRHCDHLLRDDIAGHDIQRVEEVLVIAQMGLADVVL